MRGPRYGGRPSGQIGGFLSPDNRDNFRVPAERPSPAAPRAANFLESPAK
jgi:hypothetical protein